MEVIILAGGLGTRLQNAVADLPKPMALINGRPFLDYLLNYLRKNGVTRAVLATGYKHERFEERYGKFFNGIEINYSVETKPLGTGGAILQALQQVAAENTLIVNGDTFFEVDLKALQKVHAETNASLTLALKPMQQISRYGIVKLNGSKIIRFEEKQPVEKGHINGGVYFANTDLFDNFNLPARFSFEEDFLKPFTGEVTIHSMISDTYFIDIGIPEDFYKAQRELSRYE